MKKIYFPLIIIFIIIIIIILICYNFKDSYAISSGTTMKEIDNSIVSFDNVIYTTEQIKSDMDKLCSIEPNYCRIDEVGKSVLGRPIYAIVVGNTNLSKDSSKKLLVIGNMHARELQSAQVIMRQAEFYIKNIKKYYNGQRLSDIFSDSAIYFIPTTNPDGNEIAFAGVNYQYYDINSNDWVGQGLINNNEVVDSGLFAYSNNLTVSEKNKIVYNIKNALIDKLTFHFYPGSDYDTPKIATDIKYAVNEKDADGYSYNKNFTFYNYKDADNNYKVVNYLSYTDKLPDRIKEYNSSITIDDINEKLFKNYTLEKRYQFSPNYFYKDYDLQIWKANVNGIDLHYNWYEKGVNYDDVIGLISKHNSNLYASSLVSGSNDRILSNFSSEAFVGENGIVDENKYLNDYIEKNGLYEYAITYHGRATTIVGNYVSSWQSDNFSSKVEERKGAVSSFVKDLALQTKYKLTELNSDGILKESNPMGFVGWYEQKFKGIALNIELGWATWDKTQIVKDSYPLLNEDGTQFVIQNNGWNGDACPIDNSQLSYIFDAQKYTPLYIIQKYANSNYINRIYTSSDSEYDENINIDWSKSKISDVIESNYIPVTSISLSNNNLDLNVSDTFNLNFTISPSDATIKDVIWKSNDSSIAFVNQDGLVTAISKGSTLITVTSEDGSYVSSVKVSVKDIDLPVTFKISSDSLVVDEDNKILKIVKVGNLASDVIEQIETNGTILGITSGNNFINSSDIVKTGDVLNVSFNDNKYLYNLSVLGDVTDSGNISLGDVAKLYKAIKQDLLNKAQKASGDVNFNGEIDVGDVAKLYRYIKGRINEL